MLACLLAQRCRGAPLQGGAGAGRDARDQLLEHWQGAPAVLGDCRQAWHVSAALRDGAPWTAATA